MCVHHVTGVGGSTTLTASDVLILLSDLPPSTRDRVVGGLRELLSVTVVEWGDTQGREDLATHSHTTAVYTHSHLAAGPTARPAWWSALG